jgi:hypothetical protein
MPKNASNVSRPKSTSYIYYAALVAAYFAITFLTPPDPQTLAIPFAAIWFAAFYGYANLSRYARTVRKNKEGKPLSNLTTGLMLLAYGLPISAITSGALQYYARTDPGFLSTATIITNYMNLVFPLIGFNLIAKGARGLSETVDRKISFRNVHTFALVFIVVSVMYCAFVLYYGNPRETYHLPIALTLTTLVMPYLFTWFLGLVSALDMRIYNARVPGVLFRRSWKLIAYGIAAIVMSSIVLQYLTSLRDQLLSLSIGALLLLIYILLIIISIGYILVAWGAKRLQHIEEV